MLAIETASAQGSLALIQGKQVLAEYTLESPASYLSRLLPGIEGLFQDTRRRLEEVEVLVVSAGPGNYTGLRIGLATAKGLALAHGCPVVMVPTLETLAANFPFAALPICPVMDAKKNQVYAAFFRCPQETPERLGDNLLLSVNDLAAQVTEPTIFTGPGLERYGVFLQTRLAGYGRWAPPELCHLRASVLARLGLQRLARGPVPKVDQLTPDYLRPAEAELPRATGHLNASD